jgi:RimJ/RimL family protein N-acetyltransferase
MQLKPVDTPELWHLAAEWLARKENYQWLDFGDGRQLVSAEWLKIASQRGTLAMRMFTADDDETPIGIVALGNINRHFGTATYWTVLGDKSHARRGYATRATSRMLTVGFSELGLRSIATWIVDHNPSVHVALQVRFKLIGRQRQCHLIDGRAYDRLWLDILPSEHKEL